MARKEALDRPLLARVQAQLQTTDVDSLLHSPSDDLLTYLRKVPLTHGFWGGFKRLAKAAEKVSAPEPTAALLARLDTADLPRKSPSLPDPPLSISGGGRMAFDGRYATILSQNWSDHGVHIVDMDLPAAPTPVSHTKLQNLVDIAIQGTTMALLQSDTWNSKGRLSCYDISDPAHPKPLGGIELSGGIRMAAEGTLLAVLTSRSRQAGLQLVETSVPGTLQLLGKLTLSSPVAIQVQNSIAYIVNAPQRGSGNHSLVIIDLSQPLQPRTLKEISIPPTVDLIVKGRYAYLACSSGRGYSQGNQTGLAILDLAPPDFAGGRQIAKLPLGNIQSLDVQGRYVYASLGYTSYNAKNTGGLRIVDVVDPTHPQIVGQFLTDDSADIQVCGEVACISIKSNWYDRFRALHVGDPTQPLLLGVPPSSETLGYMKRRGRRLLHALALQDPEAYVQTATQFLIEAAATRSELDPRVQWITMDLLYGGGTRYQQQHHGRGAYSTRGRKLSLHHREERFPELWDRYPELAEKLYTTPKLPWQIWETACKILRSAQTTLPTLNERMLTGFLTSGSPLLRAIAARQVIRTLEAGKSVAADIAAQIYFGGTRRQRAAIEGVVHQQEAAGKWAIAFSTRLYRLASATVTGPDLPRKSTLAFALLVTRFPTLFQRDLTPKTVTALFNTRRPDFTAWGLEILRSIQPTQLTDWLTALELLPPEVRESAAQAVLAGMADKEVLPRGIEALVYHPTPWVRQTGWRILAHSRTSLNPIASVWADLLDSYEPTPELLTAFESPDALALFSRCSFDSELIAERLNEHPFLIPLFPVVALEKVVAVLPPSVVMKLVSEATEAQWPGLQSAILLGPLLPENRSAFWRAAFAAIGAAGEGPLTQRLLQDSLMQAAFLQLADISEYLKSANPVFGPLLGQWIAAHADLLRRDSAELLQVATHPLPDIRSVGLSRVQQLGMALPFALRLLESELPPSVALGKTFFEEMAADEARRTEGITALCDSPKPSVRAYGRELLAARPEMLGDAEILDRLSENPDPETQAFVAGQLLAQPAATTQTEAFDRAVLRARDKGRRAKELVKTRLDSQPTSDIPLLLEMARSRTPRDADWALSQLAKLALEGVEIPGFTLDGVAGG